MADSDDKKGGSGFRWAVRLIVLVGIGYFFHPLFMPPVATQPTSTAAADSITVTFMEEPGKDEIYQQLTLTRDGGNTVKITRHLGDPDLPEGGGWKMKKTDDGAMSFVKTGLLTEEKGKRLFQQIVDTGMLDLKPAPPHAMGKLKVAWAMGSQTGNRTGPAFVARAYHWQPPTWKNQIRWQSLILLLKDDTELRNLISKKDIILVDE